MREIKKKRKLSCWINIIENIETRELLWAIEDRKIDRSEWESWVLCDLVDRELNK